jgi:hypothetical protein
MKIRLLFLQDLQIIREQKQGIPPSRLHRCLRRGAPPRSRTPSVSALSSPKAPEQPYPDVPGHPRNCRPPWAWAAHGLFLGLCCRSWVGQSWEVSVSPFVLLLFTPSSVLLQPELWVICWSRVYGQQSLDLFSSFFLSFSSSSIRHAPGRTLLFVPFLTEAVPFFLRFCDIVTTWARRFSSTSGSSTSEGLRIFRDCYSPRIVPVRRPLYDHITLMAGA